MTKRDFTEAYRDDVDHLIATRPLEEAMAMAVGSTPENYKVIGNAEADLLGAFGLRAGHRVIDVGCGSGRLSSELGRRFGSTIDYLGVDVMPKLLDYARKSAPKAYRFEVGEGLSVPAPDGDADFVVAFSLFTHLRHEESYVYLKDCRRALKPGGRIIFSFLEASQHWNVFQHIVDTPSDSYTIFIERSMISTWAEKLGLTIDDYDPRVGQTSVVLGVLA